MNADKTQKGEYTNASEVVRDAVRRLQASDAATKERLLLAGFEAGLPEAYREGMRRSVQTAFDDIEAGRLEGYDSEGLRSLVKELVAGSVKRQASRKKAE